MLKKPLLLFSLMLLVSAGTAFADISSCSASGSFNNCVLYETQSYNGNPNETSGPVAMANPWDLSYQYIILLEPTADMSNFFANFPDVGDWSDVLKFFEGATNQYGNDWYVQLYSKPLDSALISDVIANSSKMGVMNETAGGPTTIPLGTDTIKVYSDVPEPGSILLFSVIAVAVVGSLKSRLAKA